MVFIFFHIVFIDMLDFKNSILYGGSITLDPLVTRFHIVDLMSNISKWDSVLYNNCIGILIVQAA
jgi:hypothetical protein